MNRRLRMVLEDAAAGRVTQESKARANWLLVEAKQLKARRARKVRPAKEAAEAEARRRERRHRDLEEQVHLRAAGRCELCLEAWAPWDNARVMHHLELGSSKARNERLENCMSIHPACHQAIHISELAFVPQVKAWAERNGYPLPNRKAYR